MDYRRTKYCPVLVDIKEKKKKIEYLVKEEHPYAKDMHAYISDNSENFKVEFLKAYNMKCAYCGVSVDLIKKNEFEIDHFLYKKSPIFKSKKDAGYIAIKIKALFGLKRIAMIYYIQMGRKSKIHLLEMSNIIFA